MPTVSEKLPSTLLSTTSVVKIRVLSCGRGGISSVTRCRRCRCLPLIGDEFLALGAQRQIFPRFFSEALALGRVEDRFAHHAPDDARPEVIFAVKALDPLHQLAAVQARIRNIGKLVT